MIYGKKTFEHHQIGKMEGESSDCFVAMLGVNSILTMFEEDGGRWV